MSYWADMKFDKEINVAKDIAMKAEAIMLQYFDGDQHVEHKADDSPVTIADKKINRLVIEELAKQFDDGVVGEEERTADYGMGRRWICDPIDGTKPFVWGVPTAMFSLALAVDGVVVAGVAYDPFLKRLYEAQRGGGAFCNGAPIHVSKDDLSRALVTIPAEPEKFAKLSGFVQTIENKGARIANFHGAVYKGALIARSRLTAYLEPSGVEAYDIAAVHVIVEEAGGRVTLSNGSPIDYSKPFKGCLMSNGVIHEALLDAQK